MNAGIIVDAALARRALPATAASSARSRNISRRPLSRGDTFFFAGLVLEVETDRRHRPDRPGDQQVGAHPDLCRRADGDDAPTSPTASAHFLARPRANGARFPDDVREWLEVQAYRSALPAPDQLLVETFPHEGRHYMVAYSFEGWNAHQSLGMLITRRMESAGLQPLGFVANDYALAVYGLEPVTDPAACSRADILEDEFVEWVQGSHLLKRAFREVAVIGGLVERQHPGKRKIGAAGHLLDRPDLRRAAPLRARPSAARGGLGGRQAAHDRCRPARATCSTARRERCSMSTLDRVSPMAVPVLVIDRPRAHRDRRGRRRDC